MFYMNGFLAFTRAHVNKVESLALCEFKVSWEYSICVVVLLAFSIGTLLSPFLFLSSQSPLFLFIPAFLPVDLGFELRDLPFLQQIIKFILQPVSLMSEVLHHPFLPEPLLFGHCVVVFLQCQLGGDPKPLCCVVSFPLLIDDQLLGFHGPGVLGVAFLVVVLVTASDLVNLLDAVNVLFVNLLVCLVQSLHHFQALGIVELQGVMDGYLSCFFLSGGLQALPAFYRGGRLNLAIQFIDPILQSYYPSVNFIDF